jgi:hypothetical protein
MFSSHFSYKHDLLEATIYGPHLPLSATACTANTPVWGCLVCKNLGKIIDKKVAIAQRALDKAASLVFDSMTLPATAYELVPNAKMQNNLRVLQIHFDGVHMMCDDNGSPIQAAIDSFHAMFPHVRNPRRATAAPGTIVVDRRRDREDDDAAVINGEATRPNQTAMTLWMNKNPKQHAVMDLFAAHGVPFSQIDSPQWHAVLSYMGLDPIPRKLLRDNMIKVSNDLVVVHLAGIAKDHGCVSLCVDAGTKVHRYLGVILHAVGFKPILLELLDEAHLLAGSYDNADFEAEKVKDDESRRHTKKNYVTCLSRICDRLLTKHHLLTTSIVSDNCASISGAIEQIAFGPGKNFGVINGRCTCHGLSLLVALLCKHHKLIVDGLDLSNKFVGQLPFPIAKQIGIKRLINVRWASSRDLLKSVYDANADDDKHSVVTTAGFPTHKVTSVPMRRLKEAVEMLDKYVAAIRVAEGDDSNQIHSLLAFQIICFNENDYGFHKKEDPSDEDLGRKGVVFKGEGSTKDVVADIWKIEKISARFDNTFHARLISASLALVAHFASALDRQLLSTDSNNSYDSVFLPQIVRWMTTSRFVKAIVHFLNKRDPRAAFTMAQLAAELTTWHTTASPELIAANQKSFTTKSFDAVLARMDDLDLKLLADVVFIIKCTPASEASAERGFAAVDQIVSDLRTSLAPVTVAAQTKYRWLETMKNEKSKAASTSREITAEEAKQVSTTISKVIDMAVEKAVVVQKARVTRFSTKKMKEYCEGPVLTPGRTNCESFNSGEEIQKPKNDKLYTLVQCAGECRKTRCHVCWGFTARPTKEDAAAFVCSVCRANDWDDWFLTKVNVAKINDDAAEEPDQVANGLVDWNAQNNDDDG